MTAHYITDSQALAQFCSRLANSDFVAIDTEFVRERTYYPQLALIQIGTAELIACVDPLAIDDLSSLDELLQNPGVTKVLHSGSQDMEIFFHRFGHLPRAVFDTQIAATLLGLGEQLGYANLVKELLGLDLDKTQSRTDWLRRPLDPAQISYAEDDVRHLATIYPLMRQRLQDAGRLDWLDEDFTALCDERRYRPNPEQAWLRVKGTQKLRGVQLAILSTIAAWREETAIASDLPRRHVLTDEPLVDLCRLRPRDTEALSKLRGLPAGVAQRHGNALLACIRAAEALPKEAWPKLHLPRRLESAEDALVDALNAIIKLCAQRYQLSPSSLTSRKELEDLVRGERDLSLLQGWRRHHGGDQVLAFVNGQLRLECVSDKLALNPTDSH
ncbi:MAG: ribonuclease D [Gammaproteobacteria bacterium]|nr:ribonuclease D [Gammaproteobacteria bacterium]